LLARKSLGLAYHAACTLENEIRAYAAEVQEMAQDLCAPTIFLSLVAPDDAISWLLPMILPMLARQNIREQVRVEDFMGLGETSVLHLCLP